MEKLLDKITILHKFRTENDIRLNGLESIGSNLKVKQMKNHKKIIKTPRKNVPENFRQYLISENIFQHSKNLIDKVNTITEENLMIINLYIFL